MKITLKVIGKTQFSYLEEGIALYEKRLKHYCNFTLEVINDVKNPKNLSHTQLKEKEGELILKKIQKNDILILLDENGKQFTSVEMAEWIEKKMLMSNKNLVFLIGGAFGFSDAVYNRADFKLSFSKMTFSHQMIRLFFVEQLYRAYTILKNESYHHQ